MPEPSCFTEPVCRCNAVTTVSLSGKSFQENIKGINIDLGEWAQAWGTLIGQAIRLPQVSLQATSNE